MKCREHYVDNQGMCHRCGKPMNFDYWLASIGPDAYTNFSLYTDEWERLIEAWESKQMRCLICGDSDVTWVTTVMQNEEEGYEEYSCASCRGRSEYGIKIVESIYTGKDNVYPFEQS